MQNATLESPAVEAYHIIEQNKGKTGNDIAADMEERAKEIQEEERSKISATLSPRNIMTAAEIATTLLNTARNISATIGDTQTDVLEGNVAGYANLDQEGSSVLDATTALNEDGTYDVQTAEDLAAHEARHEQQSAAPNAEAITVDGETFTYGFDLVETDAQAEQSTVKGNSTEYQQTFGDTSDAIGLDNVREVTTTGDMVGLAEKLREEGHDVVVEDSYAVAA